MPVRGPPIKVPAHWEMEGFHSPDNVGGYLRKFEAPGGEGRLKLRFDGVYSGAEVWVNGQRLAYHEGGATPFEIDVTDVVQPGENLLALRVTQHNVTSDELDKMSEYADFDLAGIIRSVYLFRVPEKHIAAVEIATIFDKNYRGRHDLRQNGGRQRIRCAADRRFAQFHAYRLRRQGGGQRRKALAGRIGALGKNRGGRRSSGEIAQEMGCRTSEPVCAPHGTEVRQPRDSDAQPEDRLPSDRNPRDGILDQRQAGEDQRDLPSRSTSADGPRGHARTRTARSGADEGGQPELAADVALSAAAGVDRLRGRDGHLCRRRRAVLLDAESPTISG